MSISIATVWIRGVSARFDQCERESRDAPIDVQRATQQHSAYELALTELVGDVRCIPADDGSPDCVFVEDTAVIIDSSLAVITRPGAPSRRGETPAIAAALGENLELRTMLAPALVDGGDVLRVRDHLFIGMSARTNEAGSAFLSDVARERGLVPVVLTVPRGLHLKSSCSLADENTLLVDPGAGLDLSPLRGIGLECIEVPEPRGANVLAVGQRRLLASAAAPRTIDLLGERGLHVTVVEASEFHSADGALTCPSLRVPAPGAWCT